MWKTNSWCSNLFTVTSLWRSALLVYTRELLWYIYIYILFKLLDDKDFQYSERIWEYILEFCCDFASWTIIELERNDIRKTRGFSKKPMWIFLVLDACNDLQYVNILLWKILSVLWGPADPYRCGAIVWYHSLWLSSWPEWRAKQSCIVWKSRGKTAVKAPSLSECRKGGVSSITLFNDCLLPFLISLLWGTVNHSRDIGWARNSFPFLSTKPVTGPTGLPEDSQENRVFSRLCFIMTLFNGHCNSMFTDNDTWFH